MHTLSVSAVWPATVLTVSGTRVTPPWVSVSPPHPAEVGGRANVTSGSTCTLGGTGPLSVAARTMTRRPTTMTAMAAINQPRFAPMVQRVTA